MPSANIIVETEIDPTFRVKQIASIYDVKFSDKSSESWDIDIPIEGMEWGIGLIVGPSGSGKSTIGKQLFGEAAYHENFSWPDNKSVVDGFPQDMSIKEICSAMISVGFNTTPNWSRPYRVLSTGEKFRVELSRILAEGPEITVIDEFTSVVDRAVAQIGAAAFRKAVDRGESKRKYIMLSCHYDIIDWLQPDWIYDLRNGKFTAVRLRRPEIKLQIYKTKSSTWGMFKRYHYLTASMNSASQCFIAFYNNNPVAFHAILNQMGTKKMKRGTRLVVLPDYQGVGIGGAFLDWTAKYYHDQGNRFIYCASHPGLIHHWNKSPYWKIKKAHSLGAGSSTWKDKKGKVAVNSNGRSVVTVEYVGQVT